MKKSRYTIVVPLEKNNLGLLVHSYTGAMDIIGPDLLSWFLNDSDIHTLPMETKKILMKRGYLWEENKGEEKEFFKTISEHMHKKNIENSVNSFWVIPTYRCNLRCYYCFQSHKIHAGEGIGKDIMSTETIEALFTAFEELGGPGPRAKIGKGRYITLFGGEPLMSQTIDAVKTIVTLARQREYRVGAITNGVELHHFKDLLGPDKIRWIQITLDGLDKLNDKRRFPIKGDGFLKIIDNISMALDTGCQVALRTNTDKTLLTKIPELEQFAKERGWINHKGFFWYMTPVESHVNKSSSSFAVSNIDIIKQVQKDGNNTIAAPYRNKFLKLLKSLENDSIAPHIETSACGAHTRMYYFDPQGLIYSCAEQVSKPEFAVGSYQGSTYSISPEKSALWLSRHVGNMPVCSGCKYAFFCGGGCANAARLDSGEFLGPRCYGIQESFQHSAAEYGNNYLNNLAEFELAGYQMKNLNADETIMPNHIPQQYIDKITAFAEN